MGGVAYEQTQTIFREIRQARRSKPSKNAALKNLDEQSDAESVFGVARIPPVNTRVFAIL
jgi:hypothetical protein